MFQRALNKLWLAEKGLPNPSVTPHISNPAPVMSSMQQERPRAVHCMGLVRQSVHEHQAKNR